MSAAALFLLLRGHTAGPVAFRDRTLRFGRLRAQWRFGDLFL